MAAGWQFSSNASSAARGDQSNSRGSSGVTINHGGSAWQNMLPVLAIVVVVALFVRRPR
jgi:hypothetical protein